MKASEESSVERRVSSAHSKETSAERHSTPLTRRFRFERIEAWQLARALNKKVYAVTRQFPKEELFALTSQLRRASVSVSSNIAEGAGRNSDVDFAHFLEISYGSLMEVVSQLFLALDESYVPEETFIQLANDADLLAGKIAALSKSLGRISRIDKRDGSRVQCRSSSARDERTETQDQGRETRAQDRPALALPSEQPSTLARSSPLPSNQPSTLVNRPSTD